MMLVRIYAMMTRLKSSIHWISLSNTVFINHLRGFRNTLDIKNTTVYTKLLRDVVHLKHRFFYNCM